MEAELTEPRTAATGAPAASAEDASPGQCPSVRPKLLVANFFPAFHPPRSGGEQRYYYLYRHLASHYDITLISPTYSHHSLEEVSLAPHMREIRVPKDRVFDRLHWDLSAKGIGPECSGYVVALAADFDTAYGRRFAAAALDADVIVHESPFTLPYDRSFGVDDKPRIYNAYNVEHRLAREILRGDAGARGAEFVRFLEGTLVRKAAAIFATSEEDRALLASDFDVDATRIVLVPNGFEPDDAAEAEAGRRDEARILFIGSAHPPNAEAVRFIAEQLAPALPDVQFRVAGAASQMVKVLPENVRSLGVIDERARRQELARCGLAINPMFAGSGTNLKVLDYLAAGAPVLATEVGARGLGLIDGMTAFVAKPDAFAERLRRVLADRALRERVARAGRDMVFAEFTWKQIAERAHAAVARLLATTKAAGARGPRPLLLVVNDFPVGDAAGGGEVRIRELSGELGRTYDVVLLCFTQKPRHAERWLSPGVREIGIPKTKAHRDAEVTSSRGEKVSVADLVAAEYCHDNAEFVAALSQYAARANAVVFEHPFLVPLCDLLPPGLPVVYSSLNVETRLKTELLATRRDASARAAHATDLERRMLERADLVVCVSEQDAASFRMMVPTVRTVVVENGVRVADEPAHPKEDAARRKRAIFLGSAHPPNTEAAHFLIDVVAPALPALEILIVGSVCSTLGARGLPANVHLVGLVTEAEKNALLARADLALNPMFRGGGSSLKVPDFLAAGLPLVSTAIGVRGYALASGEHYVEADRDAFVETMRALLADAKVCERIARAGRRFVAARLDWRVLGRRYRRALDELLGVALRPRVLVVTYRLADPPPGGAERFLVHLLRELHRRGNVVVDVATTDIDTITDHWHFSATYESRHEAKAAPDYVESVYRFPVEPAMPGAFDACRRLFALWMEESREQAPALHGGGDYLLLGGWNFPEARGGTLQRWTSREAQCAVTAETTTMRLTGHAPIAVRATIRQGSRALASRTLSGPFTWEIGLDAQPAIVTLCLDRAFESDGDPRELGVLVREIAAGNRGGWKSIPLEDDIEARTRRANPSAWVASLIDITRRRSATDDAAFLAVRGPLSAGLEQWLEANVGDYDVVLAQGTPFATPAVAGAVATAHGVPLVQLPHFHMEDRYYHWRRYYRMFVEAARVVASSTSVKRDFFDRIGAPSVALPGGGVDLAEFSPASLERAEAAFRTLHCSTMPFVLVLGRKTAAKRYRLAIEAIHEVNRDRHRVDLVLMGPDEDGVPVTENHVHAYGEQRRDVVIGALAHALCLVNMSESESFGIVLLESWLAGRPVIAQRRCAAFTDLVAANENGFLAESAAEIARAIDTYLIDPACAARHADAGRRLAAGFSWTHLAEQFEAVLAEAAATRQNARASGSTLSSPVPAR